MIRYFAFGLIGLLVVHGIAHAQPSVIGYWSWHPVSLELAPDGAVVQVKPGSSFAWRIDQRTEDELAMGLAGYTVNLLQATSNPAPIALTSGTVPAAMAGFSRPAGVCNPPPQGSGLVTGFGGTPVADPNFPGAVNLVQIGGMQNTFGIAIGTMGQDLIVDTGIGQGATAQVVTSGTFVVPTPAGSYTLYLDRGAANVIGSVGVAPSPTTCVAATVSLGAPLTFTVRCVADLDDGSNTGTPDGSVSIDDLLYFLAMFDVGNLAADLDENGEDPALLDDAVDISDLLFMLAHFDAGC